MVLAKLICSITSKFLQKKIVAFHLNACFMN